MGKKTLVVVGGGAAGFFCAINVARMNRHISVIIVEKSSQLLAKVKVSGGGRCNVTHSCSRISDMAGNYPRGSHFLKKAFGRFFVNDTIAWFAERKVKLKTEEDGRMFPETDDSQTIISCFLGEAEKYDVQIKLRSGLLAIKHENQGFLLSTESGMIRADYVCLATGGLAAPGKAEWLRDLGHTWVDPVPSLFTFNIPCKPLHELKGISVPKATIRIEGTGYSETGPVLITHWGLSGPAVLKLSANAARDLHGLNYHFHVSVNWLADYHEQSLLERLRLFRFEKPGGLLANHPPEPMPLRLWQYFLNEAGASNGIRWADLPATIQNRLAKTICGNRYEVRGKTTFKEEFVTAGGISLAEVDSQTMESKIVPGLYFAGELLDIDGITGGYNFQACWTTAMIAAEAISGYLAKD